MASCGTCESVCRSFVCFLLLGIVSPSRSPVYKLVPTWPLVPSHFQAQEFSTGVLVGGNVDEVFVAQRGNVSTKMNVFSEDGTFLRSWETEKIDMPHGTRVHIPAGKTSADAQIWVTDVGSGPWGHTVKAFDRNGTLLHVLGTPGQAGTGKNPVQFDQPADVAFNAKGEMYVVDGDGGLNNRLLKFSPDYKLEWVSGGKGNNTGEFYIPHSVEVDVFGQVWVADRANNRTQVFDGASQPRFIGEWTSCFKGDGPYSVRFSADKKYLLVIQLNLSRVLILAAPSKPGFLGNCTVIDTIQMAPGVKPHLLSVSQSTGAFYVGEIGANQSQKFVPMH
ncbi:PREDICTED: NHL repeat-containing protein 3-like [Branchiostoma belcheri]|uniref:NHL repeat-containing protein 3 n=1 Tax=Branchiostoma belcheri TaxID=7741 RepID=A0A6P4YZJ7_BRABE|nr:PREDICTED: NHL repeat-containing protein 3-like [Branchiostoma belcheri]